MAVDTQYDKVRLLVQGNSLTNQAVARQPTDPLYATTTVVGTATPGGDHVALDGRLSAVLTSNAMSEKVVDAVSMAGTGTTSTQTFGGTIEVVVEVNQTWPIGATIAELAGIKFTIESPGLIRITGASDTSGYYVPPTDTRTVFIGTSTTKLYIAVAGLSQTFYTQVGGNFSYSPNRDRGDSYKVCVVTEAGTEVFSGFSRSNLSNYASALVGNAMGAGDEVAASPSEYLVSVVRHQAGYLPAGSNYPYIFTLTQTDSTVYAGDSIGVTATAKNTSGTVMGVYSATIPLNGLSIAQAAAFCFTNIAAQLPAQSGIPAASSDVQGAGGATVRLLLPIRGAGWSWVVVFSGPSPARYTSTTFPGAYAFGSGLPEIFEVILTKGDPGNLTNYNIKRANRGYNMTPATFTISTNGRILDTAIEDVRSNMVATIGGTTTITAPSQGQRGVRITVPASPQPAWLSDGGLAGAFEWSATKIQSLPTGATKLYGMRVTGLHDRLINSVGPCAFPSLPWAATNILPSTGVGVQVPTDVPFYFPIDSEAPGAELVNLGYATTDHTIPAAAANRPITATAPGGGLAIQLNGSSDPGNTVVGLTPVAVTIGAGDYTTELYVYINTFNANMSILAMDGNDIGGRGILQTVSDNRLGWSAVSSFIETGADSIVANTWYHVAYSRQSGTGRLFLNGVLKGSSTDTEPVFNSAKVGPVIGFLASNGFGGTIDGFVDDVIVTLRAKYAADFTPAARGSAFPPQINADVTGAGYNDVENITCTGAFNTQATAQDVYFSSSVTLGDVSPTGDVFSVDGNTINFTGPRTLANTTCTGSFVRATPTNFDGDVALDDVTSVAYFYAGLPLDWSGDVTLDNLAQISVYMLLAPSEFSGDCQLDDAVSTVSSFSLIDPIVYRLNATVPPATLTANMTQFYVDATVPAATLFAEVSAYEGFKLDVEVPAAAGTGWFGMRFDKEVPRVALQAVGIVPNTLRLNAELPRVSLNANILNGRNFSLKASVPAATLSAWTGWQFLGEVPAASSSGFITVGSAFRLMAVVPIAELSSSAVTVNVLRLMATVPAAARSGWVAVNSTVPAATAFARIEPVTGIVRLAYSFTMANSAMTRYPAYPFIQVIRMGNAYYGVAADGLYEVGGTTDNGTAIPWSWETCMSDFGQAEKKTVVSAYLGGYVPQNMAYTIKAGDVPTGANAHTTTATAVLRNHRQKFGIGRKSRFFAFGLSATQGRVAIESIEFEMATMSRRI